MHRDFDNNIAVNLLSDDKRQDLSKDSLWVGLFVVPPELDRFGSLGEGEREHLQSRHKELKVLVLLCKNEEDRRAINNSGFVVVGNSLCWQYPGRSVINILRLEGINQVRIKDND